LLKWLQLCESRLYVSAVKRGDSSRRNASTSAIDLVVRPSGMISHVGIPIA
jgi:hypothetical protein